MSFHQRGLSSYSIKHSQNFIKSSLLSKQIVDSALLEDSDIIVEIGPGKGALTEHMNCKKLIAVEKDRELYFKLKHKFRDRLNIEFANKDFLNYELPKNQPYKVIGNIPFAITTEIIKKLFYNDNAPINASLIMQKEAADRVVASGKENLFSLRLKPWFKSEIIRTFNNNDILPRPKAKVVMLNISKRDPPLIPLINKTKYLDFITYCFTAWKKDLHSVLTDLFTNNQLRFICENYRINLSLKVSEIRFEEWLILFEVYLRYIPGNKKRVIKGSYLKLNQQQENLVKQNRTRLIYKKH
jgi:23S rRNA (adenine-N6)-dimethyltransferase